MSTINFNTGQFNWKMYASNITSNPGQNLTIDASSNLILKTNGTTRLTTESGGNIKVAPYPDVNEFSLYLNTILKIHDTSLGTNNAIGLYSDTLGTYTLRHFGAGTSSILNLGIYSTNAYDMINTINILPRTTLSLNCPTIDISGNAIFANQPTFPTAINSLGSMTGAVTLTLPDSTFGWYSSTITGTFTNFTPSGGKKGGQYIIYSTVSGGTYTIPTSFVGCKTNLLNSLSLTNGNLVLITITYDGSNYYVSFAKYA